MRRGKCVGKSRRYRGKLVLALFAMVLTLCCLTGGTLAWLTSTIEPVSNTFVIGSISATSSDSTGVFQANSAAAIANVSDGITYVPGQVIEADPVITIAAGSEACYVFIHIDEENNFFTVTENDTSVTKRVIQWELNELKQDKDSDGVWTALKDYPGYYYTMIEKEEAASGKSFRLLKDKKLTVSAELTQSAPANYPVITISAAIVQKENIPDSNGNNAIGWKDAWNLLPVSFTGDTSGN